MFAVGRAASRRASSSRPLGVWLHQLWLLYLGYGVLGGIGLGLGYISPVSTLIKWFPDRPGMATGMAIMGFGGGAMIGAPLAVALMEHFRSADLDAASPRRSSRWAAIYFCFMLFGAFIGARAAAGLAAGGLRAASAAERADHVARRDRRRRRSARRSSGCCGSCCS